MVVGDAGRLLVVLVSRARTGGRQQRRSNGSTGDVPNSIDPKRTGGDELEALCGSTGVNAEGAVEVDGDGEGDLGVSTTSMPSSSHRTSTESVADDGEGGEATTAAAAATTAAHGGVGERVGVGERDRNPLSPVPGVTRVGGTPRGRSGDGASPRRQAMPQSSSSSQSELSETGTWRAWASLSASRS